MDHHCDWVDNCVGARNLKNFVLFLFFTILHCLLTFFLFLMSFLIWIRGKKAFFTRDLVAIDKLFYLVLGVLAIIFTFFCSDFLYDQWEGLKTNQSTVESHKELYGKRVYL